MRMVTLAPQQDISSGTAHIPTSCWSGQTEACGLHLSWAGNSAQRRQLYYTNILSYIYSITFPIIDFYLFIFASRSKFSLIIIIMLIFSLSIYVYLSARSVIPHWTVQTDSSTHTVHSSPHQPLVQRCSCKDQVLHFRNFDKAQIATYIHSKPSSTHGFTCAHSLCPLPHLLQTYFLSICLSTYPSFAFWSCLRICH